MQVLSFRLFGVGDASARLPSAIFAVLRRTCPASSGILWILSALALGVAVLREGRRRRVERLTDVEQVNAFFASRDSRPLLLTSASLAKLAPDLRRRLVRLYDESRQTSAGNGIVALSEKQCLAGVRARSGARRRAWRR